MRRQKKFAYLGIKLANSTSVVTLGNFPPALHAHAHMYGGRGAAQCILIIHGPGRRAPGVDMICNVGGGVGLDDHCARSARKISTQLLKCHENALFEEKSY